MKNVSGYIILKTLKRLLSGLDKLNKIKSDKPFKPSRFVYMVTSKCNSKCTHCNIWSQPFSDNELTPSELKATLKDQLFSEIEYVICTGGEASCRKDLIDLIISIHESLPEAKIQLSTNGLLPERILEVAKYAAENNFHLEIGVSLDGIGEKHDEIRGVKGNFEKVDYLIKELLKLDQRYIKMVAGIVVSDLTLGSIDQVRGYTQKLGIGITEAWYNQSNFYKNNESETLNSKIKDSVKSQPPSLLKDLWLRYLKGESIKFPCFAMNSFLVLKANGDIVPCLNKFYASAGNVRKETPSKIWHSTQMKKVRQEVKNCHGCLNSWGAGWSLHDAYYRYIPFYLKNPALLLTELKKKLK